MKKRILYNKSAFKFHKYVLANKSSASKGIVEKIECRIRCQFGLYKRLLKENKLEKLTSLILSEERKEALIDLYSYKAKAFKELKLHLTTDENGRQSNLCPYCLLDIVGTLDHIIPKTKFPEYSTNPYNLIPCCSTCNSKKNSNWIVNGERTIIDFYIDDIPDIQFLYAKPIIDNEHIIITFELNFPSGYDPIMQKRLVNHFKSLDLLKRYRENSDDVMDELKLEIQLSIENGLSDKRIINTIISKTKEMQKKFGINYWKPILQQSCVNNPFVYDFLKRN